MTLNGPINRGANLSAPKLVIEVDCIPAVDSRTRSPGRKQSVFFRPLRSAFSFCLSAAACSASRTYRVTAWRCNRKFVTAAESIREPTSLGAKLEARVVSGAADCISAAIDTLSAGCGAGAWATSSAVISINAGLLAGAPPGIPQPRVETIRSSGALSARTAGTRGCRALSAKNGVNPVDAWTALFIANSARGK